MIHNFLLFSILLSPLVKASGEFKDYMLQAPTVQTPKRGSLKGEYSGVGEKALSLKTGSFNISLPLQFPSARGNLLYPYSVSYSSGFGLSEYGIGWSSSLIISRSRDVGVVDYETDNLITPWGRMIRGASGFYYSEDISQRIKAEVIESEVIVYLPDGKKFFFGDPADENYFEQNVNGNTDRWMPRYIVDPIGVKTQYVFTRSAANSESYLLSILYGGLGDDFQYRVDFEYESFNSAQMIFSSGKKVLKNKIVNKILVNALENGSFSEIYKYELNYKKNEITPGAYLHSIQKFYGNSGLPQTTYEYELPSQFLNDTKWIKNEDLTELAAKFHTRLTNYSFTNISDFNNDARPDLELGQEYAAYQRTDEGFEEVSRPAPQGEVSSWCLFPVPTSRSSRSFLNFLGNNTESFVYALFDYGDETILDICKPNGERVDYFRLPRFWERGPKTVFADINKDTKPDLIHLRGNAYEVIYNTSFDSTLNFSSSIEMKQLNLPVNYSSFWVNDINGDGSHDIILKGEHSLYAFYGNIDGSFAKDYINVKFHLPNWIPTTFRLDGKNLQFVDVNKDSLPDVLMKEDGLVSLYLNIGDAFRQYYVPGLFAGPVYNKNLIHGDLTGDGNTELITTTVGTNDVYTLPLDKTDLGLLKSANDGQGTILSFEYSKTAPVEGVTNRKTVVAKMKKFSIGEGESLFNISYGDVALNNKNNGFLGFKTVEVDRDSIGFSRSSFVYDHDNRGLKLYNEVFDYTNPSFFKKTDNVYYVEFFDGKEFSLIESTTSGHASPNESSTLTENLSYETSNLCVFKNEKTDGAKFLRTEKTFENIAGLSEHLSCFEDIINLAGNSFGYNLDIDRDQSARPVNIKRGGISQQAMQYGFNGKISKLWEIGKGQTLFGYDDYYRLNEIVEPSGVNTFISDFDFINDQPLEIQKIRTNSFFKQFFTYDFHARLEKVWHNLGVYSQSNPFQFYQYEYPSEEYLGSVKELKNSEFLKDQFNVSEHFYLSTASGKELASVTKGTNNALVAGLTQHKPQKNTVKTFQIQTMGLSFNFMQARPGDFNFGSRLVSEVKNDFLGFELHNDNLAFQQLFNTKDTFRSISNNQIISSTMENNDQSLIKTIRKDAFGHVIQITLEEGNIYRFSHDSLGRVIHITLPNGDLQQMSYHPVLGFIDTVSRSNVGVCKTLYDPQTNLIVAKQYFGVGGALDREELYEYDGIGRVTRRSHISYDENGQASDTAIFEYLYDGHYFTQAFDSTQLGHMTAVKGEKFIKEFSYTEDEKVSSFVLTVDNKFRMTKNTEYFAQRDVKSERYIFEDLLKNQVIVNRLYERELDLIHGKLVFMSVDGAPFYHHTYNDLHEMIGSTFQGNLISFIRDESSRKIIEISENGMARSWTYNQRGLIDTMKLDFADRLKDRTYRYSPNTFLESIAELDPDAKDLHMSYSYSTDGIMSEVVENGKSTLHETYPDRWEIGKDVYLLDHVGRVESRRGRTHVYGATGRVKEVKKGNATLASYYYDEENNPIVKIYKKGDVEFYFEDSTIIKGDFYQPVVLEGTSHAVGYFENNNFVKVDVDHLGSTIRTSKGRLNVPTPYGERVNRNTDEHKVMDYALKGYDEDLLAVRMGRRYYDPKAKRFLTPDSYFLKNYDKILESPVEGNLYSYAGNEPISFVDPTGKNRKRYNRNLMLGSIDGGGGVSRGSGGVSSGGWSFKSTKSSGGSFRNNFGRASYNAARPSPEKAKIWSSTGSKSSVQNAYSHFTKHGKEFSGVNNSKQYVERAHKFLNDPSREIMSKTRNNGDVIKYNPKTNEFGVGNKAGEPKTYFSPKSGQNYFDKQK